MGFSPHTEAMHSILPIAFVESVRATQRGLIGARLDDPRRPPKRNRSERTTRPTDGAPIG